MTTLVYALGPLLAIIACGLLRSRPDISYRQWKLRECGKCGYSLKELAPGALCPECGLDQEAVKKQSAQELSPAAIWIASVGGAIPTLAALLLSSYVESLSAAFGVFVLVYACVGLPLLAERVRDYVEARHLLLLVALPTLAFGLSQAIAYYVILNEPYDGYNHWTMLAGVPLLGATAAGWTFAAVTAWILVEERVRRTR